MTTLTTLQVLAEPHRHAIVDTLRDGERAVGELVEGLDLSQPAVSKHLRILKEAGVVDVRIDAQRRLYRIRPEPFVELDAWLASYRQFWTTHLDRLEEHLDQEETVVNDATLVTSGNRPDVRLGRHLADPPSVVWSAITEREQLRQWFPCDVIVTGGRWVVGAELTFSFPSEIVEETLTGRVLVVDEPRRLSFSWGDEILTFELSSGEDGTRFVLTDELPPGIAARNAAGWETCLDRLAGQIPASEEWQPRFEAYMAAFEPTLGRQEGPPADYKRGA